MQNQSIPARSVTQNIDRLESLTVNFQSIFYLKKQVYRPALKNTNVIENKLTELA